MCKTTITSKANFYKIMTITIPISASKCKTNSNSSLKIRSINTTKILHNTNQHKLTNTTTWNQSNSTKEFYHNTPKNHQCTDRSNMTTRKTMLNSIQITSNYTIRKVHNLLTVLRLTMTLLKFRICLWSKCATWKEWSKPVLSKIKCFNSTSIRGTTCLRRKNTLSSWSMKLTCKQKWRRLKVSSWITEREECH